MVGDTGLTVHANLTNLPTSNKLSKSDVFRMNNNSQNIFQVYLAGITLSFLKSVSFWEEGEICLLQIDKQPEPS